MQRVLLMTGVMMAMLGWGAASAAADQFAYVANGGGTVLPIDTTTDQAGTPISVGEHDPNAIAITPNGQTAYVANSGNGTVTPVNLATDQAGTPIRVGAANSEPYAIAITPDGQTAYVTTYADASVTPIDLATGQAGTPIDVGNYPSAIAITPDGSTAYVTNENSDSITPIDLATGQSGSPIADGNDLGGTPDAIAMAPPPPLVSVSCTPKNPTVGEATSCTATVTDAVGDRQTTPTGTVTFSSTGSGSSDTSSCQLSGSGTSASCQALFTPTTADGSDQLTASYSGDTVHPPASGATPLKVGERSDSVSMSCPTPAAASSQATCAATVTDTGQAGTTSSPTGQIKVTSSVAGDQISGSPCTLSPNGDNQSSSCQVQVTLAAGKPHTHVITARFGYYGVYHPEVGKARVKVTPAPN